MAFLGGLGRGLLKVGKMAAPVINALPGGGYINAGINALDTKAQGGSWGDAARTGIGSAIGTKIGGLGPSKPPGGGGNLGTNQGLPGGAMNFAGGGGGGLTGALGRAFGPQGGFNETVNVPGRYGAGPEMMNPGIQQTMTSEIPGVGPSKGFDWKKLAGLAGAGVAGYGLGRMTGGMGDGGMNGGMWGPQTGGFTPSSGGMGMSSGYDMSNPNLGYALTQGRNEAIASQPWRGERGISPSQQVMPQLGGTQMGATNRNRGARARQ